MIYFKGFYPLVSRLFKRNIVIKNISSSDLTNQQVLYETFLPNPTNMIQNRRLLFIDKYNNEIIPYDILYDSTKGTNIIVLTPRFIPRNSDITVEMICGLDISTLEFRPWDVYDKVNFYNIKENQLLEPFYDNQNSVDIQDYSSVNMRYGNCMDLCGDSVSTTIDSTSIGKVHKRKLFKIYPGSIRFLQLDNGCRILRFLTDSTSFNISDATSCGTSLSYSNLQFNNTYNGFSKLSTISPFGLLYEIYPKDYVYIIKDNNLDKIIVLDTNDISFTDNTNIFDVNNIDITINTDVTNYTLNISLNRDILDTTDFNTICFIRNNRILNHRITNISDQTISFDVLLDNISVNNNRNRINIIWPVNIKRDNKHPYLVDYSCGYRDPLIYVNSRREELSRIYDEFSTMEGGTSAGSYISITSPDATNAIYLSGRCGMHKFIDTNRVTIEGYIQIPSSLASPTIQGFFLCPITFGYEYSQNHPLSSPNHHLFIGVNNTPNFCIARVTGSSGGFSQEYYANTVSQTSYANKQTYVRVLVNNNLVSAQLDGNLVYNNISITGISTDQKYFIVYSMDKIYLNRVRVIAYTSSNVTYTIGNKYTKNLLYLL